jgi:hypothetical protein
MKQEGTFRRIFFRSLMADKGRAGLTFVWFVTHDQNSRVIPALVEMELLQAHYRVWSGTERSELLSGQ